MLYQAVIILHIMFKFSTHTKVEERIVAEPAQTRGGAFRWNVVNK